MANPTGTSNFKVMGLWFQLNQLWNFSPLSTPSLLLFLLLIYDYLSLNHHSFYYNSNYCYQTYFKAWLFWQINHYELIIFVCCVTFLSVGSRYVYGWNFFFWKISWEVMVITNEKNIVNFSFPDTSNLELSWMHKYTYYPVFHI